MVNSADPRVSISAVPAVPAVPVRLPEIPSVDRGQLILADRSFDECARCFFGQA